MVNWKGSGGGLFKGALHKSTEVYHKKITQYNQFTGQD